MTVPLPISFFWYAVAFFLLVLGLFFAVHCWLLRLSPSGLFHIQSAVDIVGIRLSRGLFNLRLLLASTKLCLLVYVCGAGGDAKLLPFFQHTSACLHILSSAHDWGSHRGHFRRFLGACCPSPAFCARPFLPLRPGGGFSGFSGYVPATYQLPSARPCLLSSCFFTRACGRTAALAMCQPPSARPFLLSSCSFARAWGGSALVLARGVAAPFLRCVLWLWVLPPSVLVSAPVPLRLFFGDSVA